MTEQRKDRIIVGVDGSGGAHHALDWAVSEAKLRGATLEVVYAWEPMVPISPVGAVITPLDPDPYRHAAEAGLERVMDLARKGWADADLDVGEVAIEAHTVWAHPATALLDRAEDADLVVVGSRGRGGFTGLLLGSVSQGVVHHARGPVVVVPAEAPLPDEGDVVVGIDGSEPSRLALRWAAEEAVRRGGRLVVVHAWWTPVAVPPMGISIAPIDSDDFAQSSERLLHETVEGTLHHLDQRPREVELLALEEPAVHALLERSKGASLVVVGSRGRGGFAGMVLGSVSQQVLHHSHCAVAVIPHPHPDG